MNTYYFVVALPSGEIISCGSASLPEWVAPPVPDGAEAHVVVAQPGDYKAYWWQDGALKHIGKPPSEHHKYNPATSQWEDSRTLQDFKDAQVAQVNAAFAAAGAALTAGYPEMEQKTWDIQRQEALAWRADSTVSTPFLDAAAQARGIPADTMRQLTLANVLAFQQAAAQAVGTRQALRDRIDAATTPEAVQAVVWPAS